METTKLSSKGQMVLPKSVRDAHGWREGTEFVVESVADGVLLRTKKSFPPTSLDQVAGILAYKGTTKTLEDFDRGIRAEVARRHRRSETKSRLVIAIDTSVLVSLLVNDDAVQSARVRALFENIERSGSRRPYCWRRSGSSAPCTISRTLRS